jgi:hypothetical protein
MATQRHSSKRHRNPSVKDEPIDLDELANAPNMRGMLSFLERPPEEYARLFAKDIPGAEEARQSIELKASYIISSDSTLLPDSRQPSGSNLPGDSNQLSGSSQQPGSTLLSDSNLLPGIPSDSKPLPEGTLPADSTLPAVSNLPPESKLLPPTSKLLPDSNLYLSGNPLGKLLPDSDLLTINGRTVRIRQARTVEDAHTAGEQLLLQKMWSRGQPESEQTRRLKAGLSELSAWIGAHKTSCRDYLRSLIQKLAIEEIESFSSVTASARVYRIYHFKTILERRRKAGMTHVIRTGAVTFIDPATGCRVLPGSSLPPERFRRAFCYWPPAEVLP